MHRWLIAIFALHFVLNVSAFSLGEAAPSAPPQVVGVLPTAANAAAADAGENAAASLASVHGLMDELPDLPDTLPRTKAVQRQPVEPGGTIHYLEVRSPAISPDTLLRPPQSARA